MSTNFTPDYRDIDFQTMVARLRTILSNLESFKDYDFEGANITILMELVSYVGDLNTFFTNKLAQNIHTETANVYEVVHSLVRQQGHEPSGYVGGELVVDFRVYMEDEEQSIAYFQENDQLYIPSWFKMDSGQTTDDGDTIYYTITEAFTYDITAADVALGYVDFSLTFRQGEPQPTYEYTGEDIVSNQIVLPFRNFDMSTYPYDSSPPSIEVTVGDAEILWTRINDFFDDISGLVEENNAYMFLYDKYERNVLAFSNTRNIPELTDPIKVRLLETQGLDGAVSSGTWAWDETVPTRFVQSTGTVPDTDTIDDVEYDFMTNVTDSGVGKIPTTQYVMRNVNGSTGASNPQSLEELKEAGKAAAQSQQRNVTKIDYIGSLEARGDVTVANAWGEQEQNPNTLILENYNKAYISIIPAEWDNDTYSNVTVTEETINNEFSRNTDKILRWPLSYNSNFKSELLTYLEPRKMLGIYEYITDPVNDPADISTLPELVYFRFDFGLKVKRSYSWVDVKNTVSNKLNYYFQNSNREFGELVDFREIVEYILDTSNVSPTDDFSLIKGIQYLVVRDIMTYRDSTLVETVDSQEACEYMGGTWTTSCDIVPDEMYIYPENIYNYFPHYVELGYVQNNVDTTYNDLQPIQLGFKQFPQIAIDQCVFTNEG